MSTSRIRPVDTAAWAAVWLLFAVAVGIVMPFGRLAEVSSTVVLGLYFVLALFFAYRAIRSGDVTTHRRWMLRAVAVGLGVGIIRVVVGVAGAFGVGIESSFGAAFWFSVALLAITAEVWLRRRPPATSSLERVATT